VKLPESIQPVIAGPEEFANALANQGVTSTRLDWQPPPEAVSGAAARILGESRRYAAMEAANTEALTRITSARCVLVDLKLARDIVPGLGDRMLLHAGPPLSWEAACGPMRGALAGAALYEGVGAVVAGGGVFTGAGRYHPVTMPRA